MPAVLVIGAGRDAGNVLSPRHDNEIIKQNKLRYGFRISVLSVLFSFAETCLGNGWDVL